MVQGSRDGTGEWEWFSGENACLSPLWPEYDSLGLASHVG